MLPSALAGVEPPDKPPTARPRPSGFPASPQNEQRSDLPQGQLTSPRRSSSSSNVLRPPARMNVSGPEDRPRRAQPPARQSGADSSQPAAPTLLREAAGAPADGRRAEDGVGQCRPPARGTSTSRLQVPARVQAMLEQIEAGRRREADRRTRRDIVAASPRPASPHHKDLQVHHSGFVKITNTVPVGTVPN